MNSQFSMQHFSRVPDQKALSVNPKTGPADDNTPEVLDWKSTLPEEVFALTKHFRRYQYDQVSKADLSELVEVLKDSEIRGRVIESLNMELKSDSLCGQRIALTLALSKLLKEDIYLLIVVLDQALEFNKQHALFASIGAEIEKLPENMLPKLNYEIINLALPHYLSLNVYGADKTLEPWTRLLTKVDSRYLAEEIYKNLNERAKDGRQSGYQHVFNLLSRLDIMPAAAICEQLTIEAADSKFLNQPNMALRFLSCMKYPAVFAAAVWYAPKIGFELMNGTGWYHSLYLNYLTAGVGFYAGVLGLGFFMTYENFLASLSNASDKPAKISLAMRCLDLLKDKAPEPRVKDAFTYILKFPHLNKHIRDYCNEICGS